MLGTFSSIALAAPLVWSKKVEGGSPSGGPSSGSPSLVWPIERLGVSFARNDALDDRGCFRMHESAGKSRAGWCC